MRPRGPGRSGRIPSSSTTTSFPRGATSPHGSSRRPSRPSFGRRSRRSGPRREPKMRYDALAAFTTSKRSPGERSRHVRRIFLFIALALGAIVGSANAQPVKNIVLVHGAFADGSSWARVIPLLQAKGYHVTAVQNPLTSLADDVAATQRAIDMQD